MSSARTTLVAIGCMLSLSACQVLTGLEKLRSRPAPATAGESAQTMDAAGGGGGGHKSDEAGSGGSSGAPNRGRGLPEDGGAGFSGASGMSG